MNIVFTGDLFTGGELVSKKYQSSIIDIDVFINADIRICNLEQASSNNKAIVPKSTVFTNINSLEFLNINNINIVSLANNHIQDKGKDGFKEGLEALNKNEVSHLGAGMNILEAEKILQLSDDLFLMAYCDNNKPYLSKIQIATNEEYGINPFSYEKVIKDINRIPEGKRAILYIHWGKENTWFPPYNNIKLAKKLLENPKIHSVISTHPHRMQGKIKHNGKYAFFSLGNFLFPSFYLTPRTQMVYPETLPSRVKTTREYHPVFSLTKKIWKYSNRVSLIVSINDNIISEIFVKQSKNTPELKELKGWEKLIWGLILKTLSGIYLLPKSIYLMFSIPINFADAFLKNLRMLYYYFFIERKIVSAIGLYKKRRVKAGKV